MRYIELKNEILNLERTISKFQYDIKKTRNHNQKVQLKIILAGLYSNLWLELYEYRGYKTLDEDRDPLYKRLIAQRNIIGTIENTR